MKPEEKYPLMGKYVEVKACMKARKSGCRRDHTLHVLTETRVGLVTGYRTIWNGRIEGGTIQNENGDYELPYFVPTDPIKVLLVVFWPTMRPVLVKPTDAREVVPLKNKTAYDESILFMTLEEFYDKYHSTQPKWSRQSRETLRKVMKDVPRDEKGRWK